MFEEQLTVVVCSRRPLVQVERLVALLREQTVRPQVWVWNYNRDYYLPGGTADWVANYDGPDSLRQLPALFHLVETDYLCRMDSDCYPADPELLEEALWTLQRQQNRRTIVGPYGVQLRPGRSYQKSRHVSIPKGYGQHLEDGQARIGPRDIPVDLIKSRLQLFLTESASLLRCEFEHNHDDLYTSCRLAGARRNFHVAAGVFYYQDWCDPDGCHSRLPELDPLPIDETAEQARLAERDRVTQDWLNRCGSGDDPDD
jgi:hypothetical protein